MENRYKYPRVGLLTLNDILLNIPGIIFIAKG